MGAGVVEGHGRGGLRGVVAGIKRRGRKRGAACLGSRRAPAVRPVHRGLDKMHPCILTCPTETQAIHPAPRARRGTSRPTTEYACEESEWEKNRSRSPVGGGSIHVWESFGSSKCRDAFCGGRPGQAPMYRSYGRCRTTPKHGSVRRVRKRTPRPPNKKRAKSPSRHLATTTRANTTISPVREPLPTPRALCGGTRTTTSRRALCAPPRLIQFTQRSATPLLHFRACWSRVELDVRARVFFRSLELF